jgi:hypothetical protein
MRGCCRNGFLNCQGLGITSEIVPVVPSKETHEVVAPFLDSK